jgi:hypothetical protein
MSETAEQLKTEIIDLVKEAEVAGIGTEIYESNGTLIAEKIRELRIIDPEVAKEVMAELPTLRKAPNQ